MMLIKRFRGTKPFMRTEQVHTVESSEYVAIFVGLRAETSTIEQIWIRADGAMVTDGYVHRPQPGRTAAGEAITRFGLFRLRRFSSDAIEAAQAYADRLSREISDDAPAIL